MKKLLLLIFTISITTSFISKSQTTYIETKDKLLTGVILKAGTDKDNSEFITQIKEGKEIKHTAADLISFQLADGRKYVSHQLAPADSAKVFVEVLVNDDYKLYYYRHNHSSVYLFTKPSEEKFITVSKSSLEDLKNELKSNCTEIEKALTLVKINRNSLIRFFSGISDCDFFPYHRIKIGISAGLSQLKFVNNNIQNRYLLDGQYDYDYNYSLGLFVEIPINLTAMKFLTGINYVNHQLSNDYNGLAGNVKTTIDFQAVSIPMYFKHNLGDDKMVRPFYQIGFTFDHLFQNTNNIEAEARVIDNGGETVVQEVGEDANANFISTNYVGFVLGIGTEFNLNYRREIKTEINYSFKAGSANTLNMTSFNYIISYIF